MSLDLAFVDRFTPDKTFDLPLEAFPPPAKVETAPAATASHVRPRDTVIWLTHEGRSRCYPWWIADNYHMINDEIAGDPVWVAF